MVTARACELLRRGATIGLAFGAAGLLGACDLILAIGHGDRFIDPHVSCESGECICVGGYGDCDGDEDSGCETPLDADPVNCGACGNICDNGVCSGGSCACNEGFVDCDQDPANGCEAYLAFDLHNCGVCGHECAGGLCQDGACQPVTIPGLDGAVSLAVADDQAYVARCGDPSLATTSVHGGAVEQAVYLSNPDGCTDLVAVADSQIYFAQAGYLSWAKIDAWGPYTPGSLTSTATVPTRFLGANGTHVYWWSDDPATMKKELYRVGINSAGMISTSTGTVTAMAVDAVGAFFSDDDGLHYWDGTISDLDPTVKATALAVSGTDLVYADAQGLFKMPLGGGAQSQLVASTTIKALTADASTIFFVDGKDLRRVARDGTGALTLLANDSFAAGTPLVIDKSAVYWITSDQKVRKVAQ